MAQLANLILIIDDSPEDALVARKALEAAGFTGSSLHISDARRAIAYLTGETQHVHRTQFPLPQAILLELRMPGMDGFEFLQWFRTQPQLSRILVIAVAELEALADIKLAYNLGAHSFLTKGANHEEVRNIVRFLNDYALVSVLPSQLPQNQL